MTRNSPFFILLLAIQSCTHPRQDQTIPMGFLLFALQGKECGSYAATTDPVSGPTVGSSGNNSDNPFRALAVHPTDPNVVYLGSEGNGLFKTTDGGTTWTWLRAGLYHCAAYPEIYSIAIDSSNPSRIYAAANAGPGSPVTGITSTGGVYRSTDAGISWQKVNGGLSTGDINSVAFYGPGGPRVLIGQGAGQSTGSGSSTFFPGGLVYGGVTASTWSSASAPAGTTQSRFWQIAVRTSGILTFGANPINGSATGSGLLTSADGITWNALANPLSGLAGSYFEASSDLQVIYADLLSDAPPPRFYKSINGGTAWTNPSVNASGPIKIIGADPNTVLVGSFHQILRSTNGLVSTSVVLTAADTSTVVSAIESAPSDSTIVYAATTGLLVYKSTDSGQTFALTANLRNFINSH